MLEPLEKERKELLERRHRALELARAHPEPGHAFVEVRYILEMVCLALVRRAKLPVPKRHAEGRVAELINQIRKNDLAHPLLVGTMENLQRIGNYGAHLQEDEGLLADDFNRVWTAQLDYLLTAVGAKPAGRPEEISGLTSLEQVESVEARASKGSPGPPTERDTARPPPQNAAERRQAPRGPGEPRSAAQWLARAAEHEALGDQALAVRAYQRAVHFLVRDGDLPRARKYSDEVTRWDPGTPGNWTQLGEVLIADGDLPQALSAFRKAASLLREAGQSADFMSVAERIVAFDPDDVDTLRLLANVYLRKGDTVRALRTLQRWLTVTPQSTEVLDLLADTFEKMGHGEKASRVRQVREGSVRPPAPSGSSTAGVGKSVDRTMPGELSRWRRVTPIAAVGLVVAGLGTWTAFRMKGVPLAETMLALRGDPQHGATWAERCGEYRRAGKLDAAEGLCNRGLSEAAVSSDSRARLLLQRSLILHAKGRDREAAPLLGEVVGLRNDPEARAAIGEVCGNAQTAALTDEVERGLVAASESAPLTVFANRAGKTKRYELRGGECVAITPPIRGDDGTLWVRIARDVAPELVSVENDVRYGYVPITAIRPGAGSTDRADCETLSGAGFASRARLPCERAALAADPATAATAAARVARLSIRSGDPARALSWLASAFQLDDGTHADEFQGYLDEACKAANPAFPRDGRHFQIIDWPWDDRTAAFIPQPATTTGQQALQTGVCVLPDPASPAGDVDKVLVEAMSAGQTATGLVHRITLKP